MFLQEEPLLGLSGAESSSFSFSRPLGSRVPPLVTFSPCRWILQSLPRSPDTWLQTKVIQALGAQLTEFPGLDLFLRLIFQHLLMFSVFFFSVFWLFNLKL